MNQSIQCSLLTCLQLKRYNLGSKLIDLYLYIRFGILTKFKKSNFGPEEVSPFSTIVHKSEFLRAVLPENGNLFFDQLVTDLGLRTGVFDGAEDSTLLINYEYIPLLVFRLLSIIENSVCLKVKIYGEKKVYINYDESLSFNSALKLIDRISKIPSFYLEILQIDSPMGLQASPNVVLAKQIFNYKYHAANGSIVLSSEENTICARIHESDFTTIFPLPLPKSTQVTEEDHSSDSLSRITHVDAVITWVNSEDPEWQELWRQSFPYDRPYFRYTEAVKYDPDRFTSNHDLLFCLRSICKFVPWVRNIYIVSNCNPPNWLNLKDECISWVRHEAILESHYLPTFNSHSIESALHKIPGLAENFIYFNDDFILLKPSSRRHFFDSLQRPLINAEQYAIIRESYLELVAKDYSLAAVNSVNALTAKSIKLPPAMNLHAHVPYAHSKSVLKELESLLQDSFHQTRSAKLRSRNDLNIMSFTCQWYGYSIGKYVLNTLANSDDYLLVRPNNIQKLFNNNSVLPRFVCFNDGDSTSQLKFYKKLCSERLFTLLNTKSKFEI